METKPNESTSWIVRARCTVIKEIVVRDCTEAEATDDPFMGRRFVEDTETDIEDWDVLSVKPNTEYGLLGLKP